MNVFICAFLLTVAYGSPIDPIPDFNDNTNHSSGLWKPSGIRKECGTKLNIRNKRALGGTSAKPGDFPYNVLIGTEIDRNNSEIDGVYYTSAGSVINKWYILTGANVLVDTQGPITEIVLGETIVGEDPDCWGRGSPSKCLTGIIKRYISKIIVHEDYIGSENFFQNDIALIRVDRPIPLFSEDSSLSSIIPVCLPWLENDPGRNLAEGEALMFTGWGRTVSRNSGAAQRRLIKNRVNTKVLQQVQLPYLSKDDEKCSLFDLKDSQICAGGEKGKDSCSGDQGGPLVYRKFSPWYQVGIASFGTSACGVGSGGVYTRVTSFLPWIESKLEP